MAKSLIKKRHVESVSDLQIYRNKESHTNVFIHKVVDTSARSENVMDVAQ